MTLAALVPFTTGTLYLLFSLFIVTKLKGRRDRWAYSFWTITTVLWHFMAAFLYLKPRHDIAMWIMRIGYSGIVFVPASMLHFAAEFLQNKSLQRWLRWIYPVSIFFLACVWIDPFILNGYYDYPWGYYPRASGLHPVYVIIVTIFIFLLVRNLTLKLSDPNLTPLARERVRLTRLGILWYTVAAVDLVGNYGVNLYPPGFVSSLICLGYLAYAIARHQLLDIQVIVRKTMVFSLASTVLTCLYVAVLFTTVHVVNSVFRVDPSTGIFIACGITALCHPLIRKVQRAIDRLLGGTQLHRAAELMKFSTELSDVQDLEKTRVLLTGILEEAFQPSGLIIYIRSAPGFDEFVRRGLIDEPAHLERLNPWSALFQENMLADNVPAIAVPAQKDAERPSNIRVAAPLTNQRRLLGFALLAEKRSEEMYSEQDLILLRILANQAAVVLERPHLIKEVGAGFAHEIKMPLANIALPAELSLLELDDLLKKPGQRTEDVLPPIMKRLEYIVDQTLLASQRIDAMQQLSDPDTPAMQPVRFIEVIDRSVGRLKQVADQLQVELTAELAGDLWVRGNDQQLEIVVVNLIKNSIEAVQQTSARSVQVRLTQQNGNVLLDVEDTGPGMTQEEEAHAFEAHFSTKGSESRGMGLYVAQKIAGTHQGTIRFQRREGRTVARLALPAAAPGL